jgi:hypothetical protein
LLKAVKAFLLDEERIFGEDRRGIRT